jgi:hypothetical protein
MTILAAFTIALSFVLGLTFSTHALLPEHFFWKMLFAMVILVGLAFATGWVFHRQQKHPQLWKWHTRLFCVLPIVAILCLIYRGLHGSFDDVAVAIIGITFLVAWYFVLCRQFKIDPKKFLDSKLRDAGWKK